MKKVLLSILFIGLIGSIFTGCSDDDAPIVVTETPTDGDGDGDGDGDANSTLTGQITSDTTLTSDVIWTLDGRVTVTNGACLTIEAGTIIKALGGQEANASVLIVARGASIKANGTAAQPIIMTSTADGIQPGETVGTLTENNRGLWGGLIVLGNAPASLDGDVTEQQIEGIPANDPNGLYGGNDPADNSGTITYVSIRHGGTDIGEGNEINGLTLGGVGTGTTIDHVEVVANVDDGVEFFGGTVNASNLVVWAQGDDGIDIDQAYSGTVTNSVVIAGNVSDHALEIDGPEGSANGGFTLDGITLIGDQDTSRGEYADYRDGAQGATNNVFATNFQADKDVELDNNGVAQNFLDGALTFSNWIIEGVDPANSIFDEKTGDGESDIILNPTFTERAANWTTLGASGGANTSVFGWTFASASGSL